MLANFTVPFGVISGEYSIKFMLCACVEGGKTEMYIEMDQIKRGYLQRHLEDLGAGQVIIHSFPRNDPQRLANKFLGRVQKLAGSGGAKLYTRGTTSVVPETSSDESVSFYELRKEQNEQVADPEWQWRGAAKVNFLLWLSFQLST